ncbi:MAG TPA: hypothetical protein VF265_02060 [Nevskiaceae bacterium]
MCIRFKGWRPIIEFDHTNAHPKRRAVSLAIVGVGIAVIAFCVGYRVAPTPAPAVAVPASTALTQADANKALAWLEAKMPNTHFIAAVPDPVAPYLVRVTVAGQKVPMAFDPAHHVLLMGLVIDFDRPNQTIAGGTAGHD